MDEPRKMNIFARILLFIPLLFARFFVWVWSKILILTKQILRIMLYVYAKRLRKKGFKVVPADDGVDLSEEEKKESRKLRYRILLFATKGDPDSWEERDELRSRRQAYFNVLVIYAALITVLLLLFGNPIDRALRSFDYIGESWSYIFHYSFLAEEDIPNPSLANEAEEFFSQMLSNLKNFWFFLQVSVGAGSNVHILQEWSVSITDFMVNVIKFFIWTPILAVIWMVFKTVVTSPHPDETGERSKPLQIYEDAVVPRILDPIKWKFQDFGDYLKENESGIKLRLLAIVGVFGIIGWTALDVLTSYFLMLWTFQFGWFPDFIASLLVDVLTIFTKGGPIVTVPLIAFLIYKLRVARALSILREMQGFNEQVEESLSAIVAVNGHVGVGKTTAVSSMVADGECRKRDEYLSIMMKYAAEFPYFPWESLESWIVGRATAEDSSKLVTRAQIKLYLKQLWEDWVKDDFKDELENGKEAFFGYDASKGIVFFNGAAEVLLIEGVIAYAESYFMYFSGKKLATSNYPISMNFSRSGEFFPIYASADAYLSVGCRPLGMERLNSNIFDQDYFRIQNMMDQSDSAGYASIDGGMIAMTEGSNERGNRFDYAGLSRKDDSSNKVNDGWNQAMRLIRHMSTTDHNPMYTFIYDYQRDEAMNADLRSAAEDVLFIEKRGDDENALPFYFVDEEICGVVQAWWNRYYWYSWRPNRNKKTLLNHFLMKFANGFINHLQRMKYSYGFQAVTFSREKGGGNGLVGERTREQYFFILRKIRGDLFDTGVYAPILEKRSIIAKKGWLSTPSFAGVTADPNEFAKMHSFFIRDISKMVDSATYKKFKERILRMAKDEGSELEEEEQEA